MFHRRRKCLHCGLLFLPHPSTRHCQRYCSGPACQQARKAASNLRFREANPDYFKGVYHVERVQRWRREHPKYWQRRKGEGRLAAPVALQVASALQPVDPTVDALGVLAERVVALQAVSDRQQLTLAGLASHLTGQGLQAELGAVLNAWYDRGRALNPDLDSRSAPADAQPATARSGASPPHPQELQLGGPPAGP